MKSDLPGHTADDVDNCDCDDDGDDHADDSDNGEDGDDDADGLPDVLDVVACQFEDIGRDVLKDRHDVEGHLGRELSGERELAPHLGL